MASKGDKQYWLVKTEEDVYPLSRLMKDKVTQWTDVRNYEARIHLRAMKRGDEVLIYHSNAKPSVVVGVATVDAEAYPDPGQFDSKGDYFDPKATKTEPRWFAPDLRFQVELRKPLSLDQMKKDAVLREMTLFKNSRLSVQPVTGKEFRRILSLSK